MLKYYTDYAFADMLARAGVDDAAGAITLIYTGFGDQVGR